MHKVLQYLLVPIIIKLQVQKHKVESKFVLILPIY